MIENRIAIDPDRKYPADGVRKVERNALRILPLVPDFTMERTRDTIHVYYGGEEGVVISVSPEAFEFRLPTVEWTAGAYGPTASSRLWKRVASARISDGRLRSLVESAIIARKAEFRICRSCKQSVPPEHRHGDDLCHACASTDLGIVY